MGPGVRVDVPALAGRRRRPDPTAAAGVASASGHRRPLTIARRGPTGAPPIAEDGPPQTACARGPRATRSGRRRPGLDPPDRTGRRADRHRGRRRARRGRTTTASPPPGGARADPARREDDTVWQGTRRGGSTGRAGRAQTQEGRMPTEAKRATVAELRSDLAASTTLIVTEYRGLTVKRDRARSGARCGRQDVSYRVVKNRLMRIAAEQAGNDGARPAPRAARPRSPSGPGTRRVVAKAVLDAVRPYKLVKVTGAVVGGRAIDADGVQRLATLPPRDVLLAQLAGAIAAPATQVAGLLAANLRNLGYAPARSSGSRRPRPAPSAVTRRPTSAARPAGRPRKEQPSHGHAHPGRDPRRDRRDDRRRAVASSSRSSRRSSA